MTKYIVYFLFVCGAAFFTMGCSKETDGNGDDEGIVPSLEVTYPDKGNMSWEGTIFTLSIESNTNWSVESNSAWCRVKENATGNSDAEVEIEVSDNLTGKNREALLLLKWGEEGETEEINVVQQPQPFEQGGIYKIPVVFHMLYANTAIKEQYIIKGHLQTVLDGVNNLYRRCGQELGIEFVMAEETPDGKLLEEPGVDRVEWTTSIIDCVEFMESDEERYLDLIWNPAQYLNVVLYNFKDPLIMGISQFPFVLAPDRLPGMESYPGALPTHEQLDRPQCVSINNRYIYDTGHIATPELPDGTISNVCVTLAHEIGHFLGLRHTFSESYYGQCVDSDYCTDTPTYNRQNYERLVQVYGSDYKEHIAELLIRESCLTGEAFISDNMMDYAISYANRFTQQQADRIRYILEHGVFIPGPKDYPETDNTRATGKVDLPFEIIE